MLKNSKSTVYGLEIIIFWILDFKVWGIGLRIMVKRLGLCLSSFRVRGL